MSERAARWLREDGCNGTRRLPDSIERWLADEPWEAFCWKIPRKRIVVRAASRNRKGSCCLILEEDCGVLGSLSEQETSVLRWVNYGKTDGQIAEIMEMKLGTLKRCVKSVYDKLGVDKRAAAAAAYERLISEREGVSRTFTLGGWSFAAHPCKV